MVNTIKNIKKKIIFKILILILFLILIFNFGYLIYKVKVFTDSVNWKENFGWYEKEPRLKTPFLFAEASVSLGPAVISDNSVQPRASLADEEKPERKLDKDGGFGDAGVSDWEERVGYWADYYSLSQKDKKIMKETIMCESSGNKNAVGKHGELGLAQFKKSTFFEQMNYYGLKLDWYSSDDQIRLMAVMVSDGKWFHWTCYNKVVGNAS